MQSPTSNVVDQAINKIEAEDAGVVVDEKKTDAKATDTKDVDTSKSTDKKDDSKQPDTKADADKVDDKKTDDKKEEEEGKFTADDALEVDVPEAPKAPTDNAGIQLSPQEQKFITENIGEPIVIRGFRGTGDNVKEVELKAYSPQDIPADFKFANDQQLTAAQTGFMQMENKAQQLLGNYRQNQSNQAAQDFEKRENEGIRADVADLQRDGRMPKFKVQPGAAGFDDDPAAQQMAEVLKVMGDTNDKYLQQYQQGRPYKHIGFSEAYDLWEKQNPGKQAEKEKDDKQSKEDDTRAKRGAERSENQRGMDAGNIVKPTVGAGTTTRDLMARIDAMD